MTKKELRQYKSDVLKLLKKNLRASTTSLCSGFAETLDLTSLELNQVLNKLFKEKKLDHFGNKIFPYKRGFRFPQEIRFILRRLIQGDIHSATYQDANKIVANIERSVDKAKILSAGEISHLWGENFPFVEPSVSKYFHRHFGYLAKLGGALQPKIRLKKLNIKTVRGRKKKAKGSI